MTPNRPTGLTLVELLVIFVIIAILCGLIWSSLRVTHCEISRVRSMVQSVNAALERYQADFNAYPPETPGKDGTDMVEQYLRHEFKIHGMSYGPYIEPRGNIPFISPQGGRYVYTLVDFGKGPQPLIVDPGRDRQLGGTIDPKKGFVPDNSGADKDNLYSIDPKP